MGQVDFLFLIPSMSSVIFLHELSSMKIVYTRLLEETFATLVIEFKNFGH